MLQPRFILTLMPRNSRGVHPQGLWLLLAHGQSRLPLRPMQDHPARPLGPRLPSRLVSSHLHRYLSRSPECETAVLLRTLALVSAKCPRDSKPFEAAEESRIN